MEFDDPHRVARDSVSAEKYMAATGTPWATQAALDVMEDGYPPIGAPDATALFRIWGIRNPQKRCSHPDSAAAIGNSPEEARQDSRGHIRINPCRD